MKNTYKNFFYNCGNIMAIAAIIFVIIRLHTYMEQINFSERISTLWMPLLGLSLCYATSNLILVKIWILCLKHFGVCSTFWNATWIYGYSQLGKYIPGNIFHLAGRQVLCAAENLPPGKTMNSIVWELGISAAGVAGVFCPPFLVSLLFPSLPDGGVISLVILCGAGAICCSKYFLGATIRSAVVWNIVFLCIMGGTFALLFSQVIKETLLPVQFFVIADAYVVAWFVGLITPGAPAGMGIREAVMLLLMENMPFSETDILISIIVCRIITLSGDIEFFMASMGIRHLIRRNK